MHDNRIEKLLASPDETDRLEAIFALAEIGNRGAEKAIEGLFDDPSPTIRIEAARLHLEIAGPTQAAIACLISMVNPPGPCTWEVIDLLGEQGKAAEMAADAIRKCLVSEQSSREALASACRTLPLVCTASDSDVSLLLVQLSRNDELVQLNSAIALGMCGTAAVHALMHLLEVAKTTSSWQVAEGALESIGKIGIVDESVVRAFLDRAVLGGERGAYSALSVAAKYFAGNETFAPLWEAGLKHPHSGVATFAIHGASTISSAVLRASLRPLVLAQASKHPKNVGLADAARKYFAKS